MLAHRLACRPSIKPTLTKRLMFVRLRLVFVGLTQQTRHLEPVLVQCWSTVNDAGPTLTQHWLNVSRVLCYTATVWQHRESAAPPGGQAAHHRAWRRERAAGDHGTAISNPQGTVVDVPSAAVLAPPRTGNHHASGSVSPARKQWDSLQDPDSESPWFSRLTESQPAGSQTQNTRVPIRNRDSTPPLIQTVEPTGISRFKGPSLASGLTRKVIRQPPNPGSGSLSARSFTAWSRLRDR